MRDRRLTAFLEEPREVFHSVEHRHEIWKDDPFDVESVHAEARRAFQRLVARATAAQPPDSGRILLLRGDAGAGKTHLARAFRNTTHANGVGFVGYMQMTTGASSYHRYLLSNLIDSLDQPYYELTSGASGLVRLSTALASRSLAKFRSKLRDPELADEDVIELVFDAADRLVGQARYSQVDVDVLRALLFLQRDDARIRNRIIKYLRCEDLTGYDRKIIGGMAPRLGDDDPQRTVEHLGRLMSAVAGLALVVCVDQLEDLWTTTNAADSFRRAMTALCELIDRVPTSIVVLCCLDDFYDDIRAKLTGPIVDRIESDPEPVRVIGGRSRPEIDAIVEMRLQVLFDVAGVEPGRPSPSARLEPEQGEPTFPFPDAVLDRLVGLRTRDVLDRCRAYRDACVRQGTLIDADAWLRETGSAAPPFPAAPESADTAIQRLEQEFNDYFAGFAQAPPDDDAAIAVLLAWGLEHATEELESGHRISARARGPFVETEIAAEGAGTELILVGLCNASPRGGNLGRQIAGVVGQAKGRVAVLARCAEFPDDPDDVVTKQVEGVLASGGRRVVVEDNDLRAIVAVKAFREQHRGRPGFAAWLTHANHLSQLGSISAILDLEFLERLGRAGREQRTTLLGFTATASAGGAPVSTPPAEPTPAPPPRRRRRRS